METTEKFIMKNKLLLLLIFLPVLCFSQIQSGTVIYKIKSLNEEKNKVFESQPPKTKGEAMAQESLGDLFERRDQAIPQLEFKLDFTSTEALFKVVSGMDSDQDDNLLSGRGIAIASVGGRGIFYTDLNNDLNLRQFEHLELSILETKVSDIEWQLHDTYQEIHGYTCQKATTQIYLNRVHPAHEITVWFAKDLPFSFGPMGQAGLPGLILGLERLNYMYYAFDIKLSEKSKNIKAPTKGKRITQDYIIEIDKDMDANPKKYMYGF